MASLVFGLWDDFTEWFYSHRDLVLSDKLAIYMTVAYIVFVLVGKMVMKNRPAFDLKRELGLHNLFLCVLSLAMALGGIWETYKAFSTQPFMDVYCSNVLSPNRMRLQGAAFFWTWLFYVSKYYEFFDTAFIILRKKPLIFLHVFHHIIVVPLSLWYMQSYMFFFNNGLISNGLIHTFMYWSYYKQSVGVSVSWKKYLTKAQIIQFLWGIVSFGPWPYICGFSYFSLELPLMAWWTHHVAMFAFIYLFSTFLFKRYAGTDTSGRRVGDAAKAELRKED